MALYKYGFDPETITGIGNLRYVKSQSDLPAPSGGVITLENGINYLQVVSNLIIDTPISLSSITSLSSFNVDFNTFVYVGSGALFRGNLFGVFGFFNSLLVGNASATVWDLVGNGNPAQSILVNSTHTFTQFSGVGILDTLGSINYNETQHADNGEGIVLKNIPVIAFNTNPFSNSVTSSSPRIVLSGTVINAGINNCSLTTQSGESFIQVCKSLTVLGDVSINANQFSDTLGGEFFASDKTGSITAFANNGSGGTTVTSAAHGLTIEQTLEITNTTNYDGIHSLSNITTNTFDINVVFTANDATGDFDIGDSNDFLDNNEFNVSATNGAQIESNEIGKISNLVTFDTVIASPDTPVEVTGVAIDWVTEEERRFLADFATDGNGTLRYTGKLSKEFVITIKSTMEPASGGAKLLAAYVGINGVFDAESVSEFDIQRFASFFATDSLILNQGDVISMFVANIDDTTNITHSSIVIHAYSI